jgi:phage terminase small subunit
MADKLVRFCENYLVHLNGAKAARDAGYEPNRARITACELLGREDVQDYISKRQEELMEQTGITQKRVLQEYARIAFSDIRKFYTVDGALKGIRDLDDDAAAALAGVDVYEERTGDEEAETIGVTKKIKVFDKVKALDALGKHLGMFKNIHEITGKDGQPLAGPVVNIQLPEGLNINFPSNTDGEE